MSEARMNPDQSADLARRNAIAWDRTATKYAAEIDADVALVRGGGTNLLPPELRVLVPLLRQGDRALSPAVFAWSRYTAEAFECSGPWVTKPSALIRLACRLAWAVPRMS